MPQVNYQDESGAVVVFDPRSFAHRPESIKKRKWRPRLNSVAQQTGLLIKRSKKANAVKGLCRFCDKIVFSYKGGKASTVTVHAKCYQDSSQGYRKGLPTLTRSRGGQVELENLRKHYSWAVRHVVRRDSRDSYGAIAKEYGVARQTVVDGIKFILAHLPEAESTSKEFQSLITRLKSPEPIQPYSSNQFF